MDNYWVAKVWLDSIEKDAAVVDKWAAAKAAYANVCEIAISRQDEIFLLLNQNRELSNENRELKNQLKIIRGEI